MKTNRLLPFIFLLLISSGVFSQEKNLYWVGGQGNWSDLNKWRTQTGLIPDEVPDEFTNVFFNENSFLYPFDTVFITTGNPTCRSMTWQNIQDTVVMFSEFSQASFGIFGSLTFHPKVRNEYKGTIRFSSSETGNTITCAGPGTRFPANIWFDGSGEWTLMDTLFVFDSTDYNYIFYGLEDPLDPDPQIIHVNGTFNANGQTIYTRGFSSTGNIAREVYIAGSDIFVIGSWVINAENLAFDAADSYFLIGGSMTHTNGTTLTYHDIDFYGLEGVIRNTKIRTIHRKIHFLGSGGLLGNRNPGVEGSFTIDTVLFDGALDPMSGIPILSEIRGPNHDIHYTYIDLVHAEIEAWYGNFHRIDFDGDYWGPGPAFVSRFTGRDCVIDSIHFFQQPGYVIGQLGPNTINDLLYFKTTGTVTSAEGSTNNFAKAFFNGDGFFERSNYFNHLVISEGHWYQIQYDSLIHPGSIPTSQWTQTIMELELQEKPGCGLGATWITTKEKYTQGLINYQGPPITLEKVFVQDIKNTGTMLTIQGGFNLGNNLGFNFVDQIGERTLYWVNGEGNWSDPDHWSLSSGGPGGECPPTIRDHVFFDGGSGFEPEATVTIDLKNAQCNDFIWLPSVQNNPFVQGADSNNMHVWGSFILDPAMTYGFAGVHYFESADDDDYESIFLHYTFDGDDYFNLWNKTYFYSETGKWRLDSKFYNHNDTVFFKAGNLLLENDTMSVLNFHSTDTLYRELHFLEKTLVLVHQYQAEAWLMNAWMPDEKIIFDAGESIIRATGFIAPPMGAPPGFCDIRSYGGELTYHNIEFLAAFGTDSVPGMGSKLLSESMNTFNLVDYYVIQGEAIGTGIVDTLTFKEDYSAFCFLRNQYFISFVISESPDNTLLNSHMIDTAIFYERGIIFGGHFIGYLEAHKYMDVSIVNSIDTAVFYSNARIKGRNQFSQLVLSPNQRYWFQQENESDVDTTIIIDDLVLYGDCDRPIRIQSDSTGVQAKILYMAQNPTNPALMAEYASIRDIRMLPYGSNVYNANNTVDLGNNTNINFNQQGMAEIYYWIGGSGDWSQWWHWSDQSGGDPIEDQCVPSERITVVFDDNSFLTPNDIVTIDSLDNAYCKNMYWIHDPEVFTPVFTGNPGSNLNVFGSMLLNPGMVYDYQGLLIFDQYSEPGYVADTLTTFGHTIWNHILLQGIDDEVVLGDDLTVFTDGQEEISRAIFHEHGKFNTNGKNIHTGGYFSVFKNQRELEIVNSTITLETYQRLLNELDRTWWVDGDGFSLTADNSNIINISNTYGFITEYGDYLKYHNVISEGLGDSIANFNNIVEYNVVELIGDICMITGNFIADTVWMKGLNCGMFQTSTTNVVIIDQLYGSVNNNHTVGRGIVNKYGLINGSNFFNYCVFNSDGVFTGKNVFDTLVLYPGSGDFSNQGNKFYFQADTVQVINDSLYVRGNPCSNISLISLGLPKLAYLRMDNAAFDVSADFLNIFSVGAQSENLTFYAGANSSPLPDPNNPPPGWVFDNALGYIPGFNGRTERFCLGDEFVIKADDFNGDPSTQYFWGGSQYPGGTNYVVTEPGQYYIRVVYFEGCHVDDYINLEGDFPPSAVIAEGPFCEGDPIEVYVQPESGHYGYTWFNGETEQAIVALEDYTGGIFVTVTDTVNKCKVTPNQSIVVHPIPFIDLGQDQVLFPGESVTLDAGTFQTYMWNGDPSINGQYYILNYEDINKIDSVWVEVFDGYCKNSDNVIIEIFDVEIPIVITPNGDGYNDKFRPGEGWSGIKQHKMMVFNRWGEKIWESSDFVSGWDGKHNGKLVAEGTYFWILDVSFGPNNESKTFKGSLMVVGSGS
jgi:gliding motility-associated-like protein